MAESLLPGWALVSPRGRSLDEGVPRWFRRFGEGLFDMEDLHARTEELAAWLQNILASQGWGDWPVTALGYSNGANMAASLMLSGAPIQNAILLRPMLPFEPEVLPNLTGRKVLVAAGQHDLICRPSQATALEDVLVRAGARVDLYWAAAGHGLTQGDGQAMADFIAALLG
jgi:predicted esterase